MSMAPHSSTLAWKLPWTESLVGCSPWGRWELDTTQWLHFHFSLSCIGEGNGNPLQCPCLENPRDWGAWWTAFYGHAQSRTRLKQLSSSSSSKVNVKLEMNNFLIKYLTEWKIWKKWTNIATDQFEIDSLSKVQFSLSVMSDSFWLHELQHARPPCPSPTPGVHSKISFKSVMPSSHLILCCPLLLLPPIPPRNGVFSNESTLLMRCPKYWSFSFSISPSNEHPGLISLKMDWLDLLAVQGTLKSLLQHHS